jgi:hypothetical protein
MYHFFAFSTGTKTPRNRKKFRDIVKFNEESEYGEKKNEKDKF